MRTLIKVIFAAVTISVLMCACGREGRRGNGDDNYFSAFRTFTTQEWPYETPVNLRVDTLRDSASVGPLTLSLRHTNGYRWSNLWLEVGRRVDTTFVTDTFNISMADVAGNWYGSGVGPSRQLIFTLYDSLILHRGDTLRLRHIMRVDTLQEIEQIGIIFNGQS